jgi:hypothetical protein
MTLELNQQPTPDSDTPARTPTPNVQTKLIDIFVTQARTNTTIAGANWREVASQRKEMDYSMAALDEIAAEFVPSALGWKWWAKTFVKDLENAKLELVDILHFLASEDMVRCGTSDATLLNTRAGEIAAQYQQANTVGGLLMESEGFTEAVHMVSLKSVTKHLMSSLLDESGQISWFSYFMMCLLVGTTFDEQYSLYLGKAVLNTFRARNGYKTGTYDKKWTIDAYGAVVTLEDNAHLINWLKTLRSSPQESEIYAFLEQSYAIHQANRKHLFS